MCMWKFHNQTYQISSDNVGACGGTFTSPHGLLTSPNYPDVYPNDADCIYIVSQTVGTRINIRVVDMDIEYESDHYFYDNYYYDYHQYGGVTCKYDYLEIRDGTSEQSPLIDAYCGDSNVVSLPVQTQSTGNNVWMR